MGITLSQYAVGMEAMYITAGVQEQIVTHVNSIVRNVIKIHDHEWWDWMWSDGDQEFSPSFSWPTDTTGLCPIYISGKQRTIIDKDGSEIDLSQDIPTRWLFMDIEDIRSEYKSGVKAWKDKLEREKKERAAKIDVAKMKKKERDKKRKELLDSLSPEQRALLGEKYERTEN